MAPSADDSRDAGDALRLTGEVLHSPFPLSPSRHSVTLSADLPR